PQDTGAGGGSAGTGDAGPYTWDGPGWTEFRQGVARSGAEISVLYGPGDTRFSLGARVQSVRPDSSFIDVERDETRRFDDLPDIIQRDTEETVVTGLFFRVTRETRDNVTYPRTGSFALLSMEANNTVSGGDETFTKMELDVRKLKHLGGDVVLSGRLNAGLTSNGTPYYERFTLGGIYSIRGFRELSLSPTGGDDGFWLANCELRFPLIESAQGSPRLSGLLFLDAGQGWQRGNEVSIENLECAAGYGVRLRLPWLGSLGLDVGVPFTNGRIDERFRVHGSVGFSF
ncbi:MAG: BamA/TamA family outer membrane protein, partial [Candidatus Eisenbacteria bacterium]